MEKELNFTQQLVDNSKPGDVEYITVSGTISRLFTRFNPALVFDPAENSGYEIALCRLETYYCFQNIDEKNNVLRVSIDSGQNWKELKIPVGCYDITGINEALQLLLGEFDKNSVQEKRQPYIVLTGNKNTGNCVLVIMSSTTVVDFNVKNSIRSVLGFEAKQYVGGKRYESENKIDIVRVQSILVHCDIIKPSRVNGVPAPVIYNFFPNVSPAEKIVCQPKHLMYVPLSLSVISSMTAWITDQEGRTLDVLEERLTLSFHIRKRR